MQHIFIFHAVSNCTGSVNQFILAASYPRVKLGKNQLFLALATTTRSNFALGEILVCFASPS
ncbi:hypothetical protein LC20_02494 [Yersinia hibernica]|uniref:Uncharacterized protein n=1 Tax=Yersinia enterocolitica LC20 TaxID=1443113 RepID=A0A7U4K126_YEREN|nr:hypothetical protein LC20_02494 [Yersinia hibernica]